MKKKILLFSLFLFLGTASCSLFGANATPLSPTTTPAPTTTPEIFQPLPADQRALEAVRVYLAGKLGVDPLAITPVDVEPVQWPDSCLGLAGPDELCAQVVTDGFRVRVRDGDAIYEFHTDQSASQIRQVH